MDTGDTMNTEPLNTTTAYPITPETRGSDFSTLLMLLQVLFRMRTFHKPEQNLARRANITWSQNNFTEDGQPNPMESKRSDEENNDVKKIIKKREIPQFLGVNQNNLNRRYRRQETEVKKGTLIDVTRLYAEIEIRYEEIRNLKKELETCKNNVNKDYEEKIAKLETQIRDKDKEINDLKEELQKIIKEDENTCDSVRNLQNLSITHANNQHNVTLNDHFGPGSKIVIRGKADTKFPRMNFNLGYSNSIALHIDNRWAVAPYSNQFVLNTLANGWGKEVVTKPAPIPMGTYFVLSIQSLEKEFKICVNGVAIATYAHRVSPSLINHLYIDNAAEITSIYYRGFK